jgi:hypothetical protein
VRRYVKKNAVAICTYRERLLCGTGTYMPYRRIEYAIERTNPTNLAGQKRTIYVIDV